jgi:hypothetical protein
MECGTVQLRLAVACVLSVTNGWTKEISYAPFWRLRSCHRDTIAIEWVCFLLTRSCGGRDIVLSVAVRALATSSSRCHVKHASMYERNKFRDAAQIQHGQWRLSDSMFQTRLSCIVSSPSSLCDVSCQT